MAVVIRVDVDDTQVQQMLQRLIAFGNNPAKAMADIVTYGESSTRQRFADQAGPDGNAWLPLKQDFFTNIPKKHLRKDGKLRGTAKARDFVLGRKILIKERHLLDSIVSRSGKTFAEWGSAKDYAAIHQFGGQAGRGRKVTIPARPYLGINDQDEANILDIINRNLADAVGEP